jgi:hypothetical protein
MIVSLWIREIVGVKRTSFPTLSASFQIAAKNAGSASLLLASGSFFTKKLAPTATGKNRISRSPSS